LFHFERAQWLRAGIWGSLVGFVRPNGAFVAIPLAVIAVQWRTRRGRLPRPEPGFWIALAAPATGLALYSIFIWHLTGRFFAWSEVQSAWGRTYQLTNWIGLELTEVGRHGVLQYAAAAPVTVLNGLAAVMALVLLWPIGRTLGLPYAVFVLVNLAPAIVSGGLMSIGRFTATLFPLFVALALTAGDRFLTPLIVAFSILQGLLAVCFFTWRPPF
jgi:hypothetical protein